MVWPTFGMALPEIARYGQFTCTSCHVNPAGGGMLTTYGREFSEEKMSTWAIEGEEKFLEGLVPMSDTIFFGGDARWIKYKSKTEDRLFEKFWRMQTDLEAGVHLGPVYVTGMMGTKPAGPTDDPKEHSNLIHRGYTLRADLFDEHVMIRGGLFLPKYGLMLSDHTAYVRSASGLSPDGAQTQIELIYQDDLFEFMLAKLIESKMYDRERKTLSGFNLGVSTFVAEKNRITASVLSTKKILGTVETSVLSMGLSAVVTATNKVFAMFEINRVHNETKISGTSAYSEVLADFFTLNYEAYKGLIPYARYEFIDTDMNRKDTSTIRMGPGINWYPRPHMQLELRSFRAQSNASHSTTNTTEGLMHYYF